MASCYCKISLLFVSLVVASSILAAPWAESQQPPGDPVGVSTYGLITGVLYCSPNGNVNGSSTPVFPNASVQLQCGVMAIAASVTNRSGAFLMMLDPMQFQLMDPISNCRLITITPLSSCNANLPSNGLLVSTLHSYGGIMVSDSVSVTHFIPVGFSLVSSS
ncbi:phylloplanin-like [Punica granatum]|uniref:Phylloplanin-like n=1 Tax=Punica granatum TaxID=22663 RepID=A0A6P8DX28_PUNGR|nr:phylloplanin-like [Punica granatum]